MSLWSALFGKKRLSLLETKKYLDEIDGMCQLSHFLPASVRLNMLTEITSPQILGPGGPLHARLIAITERIISTAKSTGLKSRVSITDAWRALPDVLFLPCNFSAGQLESGQPLAEALHQPGEKYTILATTTLGAREQNPERQVRLFFEFKDDPKFGMMWLIFCATIFMRSTITEKLATRGASLGLQELLSTVGEEAIKRGFKVRKIR